MLEYTCENHSTLVFCSNMNMQEVMAYGAEAIDVVARCLALKHISIRELVEKEQRNRRQRQREASHKSAIRI